MMENKALKVKSKDMEIKEKTQRGNSTCELASRSESVVFSILTGVDL